MYAVRCSRFAIGATIAAIFFPHTAWKILEQLPDAVKTAGVTAQGQRHPVLTIHEIDKTDDPVLKPFPVLGEQSEDNASDDEEPDEEMVTVTAASLEVYRSEYSNLKEQLEEAILERDALQTKADTLISERVDLDAHLTQALSERNTLVTEKEALATENVSLKAQIAEYLTSNNSGPMEAAAPPVSEPVAPSEAATADSAPEGPKKSK